MNNLKRGLFVIGGSESDIGFSAMRVTDNSNQYGLEQKTSISCGGDWYWLYYGKQKFKRR